ncbi:unnamed protein product [Mortierella alpina]
MDPSQDDRLSSLLNSLVESATSARSRFSQGSIAESIHIVQEIRQKAEHIEFQLRHARPEHVHGHPRPGGQTESALGAPQHLGPVVHSDHPRGAAFVYARQPAPTHFQRHAPQEHAPYHEPFHSTHHSFQPEQTLPGDDQPLSPSTFHGTRPLSAASKHSTASNNNTTSNSISSRAQPYGHTSGQDGPHSLPFSPHRGSLGALPEAAHPTALQRQRQNSLPHVLDHYRHADGSYHAHLAPPRSSPASSRGVHSQQPPQRDPSFYPGRSEAPSYPHEQDPHADHRHAQHHHAHRHSIQPHQDDRFPPYSFPERHGQEHIPPSRRPSQQHQHQYQHQQQPQATYPAKFASLLHSEDTSSKGHDHSVGMLMKSGPMGYTTSSSSSATSTTPVHSGGTPSSAGLSFPTPSQSHAGGSFAPSNSGSGGPGSRRDGGSGGSGGGSGGGGGYGGSRTQFHAPLEPEVIARLDELFFKFLQRICSDLSACDSRGDQIHQPLMAKKMQRLEASTDFRPFKFRIQAFTNAFHESLVQHGLTEDILPLRKVKVYLWKHRYISRFNEDGKKQKSKGNHVWNIEARKITEPSSSTSSTTCSSTAAAAAAGAGAGASAGSFSAAASAEANMTPNPPTRWEFREYSSRIAGQIIKFARVGVPYIYSPRIWDAQMSCPVAEYSSPWLPSWLKWHKGELRGVPGPNDQSCEITVIAEYVREGEKRRLEMTFPLTVSDPEKEGELMDSPQEDEDELEQDQEDEYDEDGESSNGEEGDDDEDTESSRHHQDASFGRGGRGGRSGPRKQRTPSRVKETQDSKRRKQSKE